MNKAIVTAAIVATAILSPIAGMAITQTREALLGLAPEEAVLRLADKIDASSAKSDETSALVESLQAKVTEQEGRIEEYEEKLASQETSINKNNASVAAANESIASEASCKKLYIENPECTVGNKIYRSKSNFDSFINGEKDRASSSDIEKYQRTYSSCQTIISQCD